MYGWTISPKLPVNNFEWIKETSQFSEDLRRNYHEGSDEEYYFEADVEDKKYMKFIMTYIIYVKERNLKKSKLML